MPNQEEDQLQDLDLPDLLDASVVSDAISMNIGVGLFSYNLNFQKPSLPETHLKKPSLPEFHLNKPSLPEFHLQKPVLPSKPKPTEKKEPSNKPTVHFEVAPNTNPTFVLDTKKEAEAKALVHEIDGNIGEFAILCGAMANAYRGMVTTAPAGLFGEETVKEAGKLDAEMEQSMMKTVDNSDGFWRQILEGFAKYGEAEGDPTLAKLKRRMEDNETVKATRAERRLDRVIEKEDATVYESKWRHALRSLQTNTGLNPVVVLGKRIVPALLASRPSPAILTTALNHLPRMSSPDGLLSMIRSYVGQYIQMTDASRFFVDAILRTVSPILFPLLRFIARDSAMLNKQMQHLIHNKRIAMVTVASTTYVMRLVGWLWHMVVAIIHTVIRLIFAIIQFVVAIVVSIYASPVTGIIVNAVVALVIRFVVR